jgi:serine/threonine protein kinase
MEKGCLLTLLHQRQKLSQKHIFSSMRCAKFASDIVAGMLHMSSMRLVHRDLAARNILISGDFTAKIADFGLSRDAYVQGFYKDSREVEHILKRVPWLWMALESLVSGTYDSQSDVWSFGVLLWEIATLGSRPYKGIHTGLKLINHLQDGKRLPKPSGCSQDWYDVMLSCWVKLPGRRPSFQTLEASLNTLRYNSVSHTMV